MTKEEFSKLRGKAKNAYELLREIDQAINNEFAVCSAEGDEINYTTLADDLEFIPSTVHHIIKTMLAMNEFKARLSKQDRN